MAVAGLVVIRVGLDLAVADLSNADPARENQVAAAQSDVAEPTLAPAMSPSPVAWEDAELGEDGAEGFGQPDPEFGRATPAVAQPAWGAAERQRRADAAEAAAAAGATEMEPR